MYQDKNFEHVEAIDVSSTDQTLKYNSVIFVGTGGASATLKVTTISGEDVTFTSLISGTILPVICKKVFKTGTSATNLMALS